MENDQLQEQKNSLVAEIYKNFPISNYPGDEKLVYDNSGNHLECSQIAVAFKGKNWNDLPLSFLRYHHEAVFFFTSEAYRYYLPAYLVVSILNYREANPIPQTVVVSLTAPDSASGTLGEFYNKMNGFESQQKQLIKRFLKFMVERYSNDFALAQPQLALEKFWDNV